MERASFKWDFVNASDECVEHMDRRSFLTGSIAIAAFGAIGRAAPPTPSSPRLLFTSQGKTGIVDPVAGEPTYFQFDIPGQATWQPGPVFPNGRQMIFLSMEPRRDGPGKPFAEFYHLTPTHIWAYDFTTKKLEELCTNNRLAPFYAPQAVLSNERLLVQVVRKGGGQTYSMNMDGTDARPFTRSDEGLPYGLNISPDGSRVAFHLASPNGYQIWTCDPWGKDRTLVVGDPNHLYFGPEWSDDGEWLAYMDCQYMGDPGHDWADVCVGLPDGSEHRLLTSDQSAWFGATYGNPQHRGGGSNLPAWTRSGRVLVPLRLPNSKVAWEFQSNRPDVDHFNRDYKPELAQGGTEICSIDPSTGHVRRLTKSDPPVWDFRSTESPDGRFVAFCRAETGGLPSLWVMDSDGANARKITSGIDDLGADHPRWLSM